MQNRAILGALRAAAMIVIATGLNEVIAGAAPRYEPLYVYLLAIAVAVWLDGPLIGLGAALLGLSFYVLLFHPAQIVFPVSAAIATVMLTAVARGLARSRRRAPAVFPVASQPLLAPPSTEVLAAIDELRAEVRAAVAARGNEDSHDRAVRQSLSERDAAFALARAAETRVVEIQRQLEQEREARAAADRAHDTARQESRAAETRVAELRQQLATLGAEHDARLQTLAAHLATDHENDLGLAVSEREAARADAGAATARATEMQVKLEQEREARAAADLAREAARQDSRTAEARVAELRQQLAALGAEHDARLQTLAAHLATDHENDLGLAVSEREAARADARAATARATEMQVKLEQEREARAAADLAREAARQDSRTAETRVAELRQQLATLGAEHDAKVQTLAAHLAADHARERAATARVAEMPVKLEQEREAIREDARVRIAETAHELEQEREARAAADLARETAREESRTAEARVAELQQQLATLRAEHDAKLETLVADLATGHENDLGLVVSEREAAREEARAATARVAEMHVKLEQEREAIREDARVRIAETARKLEQEREAHAAADLARGAAREQSRTAEARVAELQQQLDTLRAEHDAKLQTLVAHLATDHENDLGEAVSEREAARAEARASTARVAEMQRQLEQEREAAREQSRTAEARVAELQQQLDTLRAEQDAKVQTLVAHLAADHENDLGQAVSERDAAQAVARAAEARVVEIQRELAHEREESRTAEARAAELQQQLDTLRAEHDAKLQTIVSHLATDHENDLGQALSEREAARAEARAAQARLGALQRKFDEEREANAARLREALDDSARVLAETRAVAQREIDRLRAPAAEPRARILVAHPDADLRASAQSSLTRAGYEVLTAADGLEALRLAIAQQPQVVIADAVMPKMNGRELCQLLKSQEKTQHIRVVLLLRPVDDAPKGELVPDEVLRKPVPFESLRSTLAALTAGSQ